MDKIAFSIDVEKVMYVVLDGDQRVKHGEFEIKRKTKEKLLTEMANIVNKLNVPDIKVRISTPTAVNSKTGFCKGISGIREYSNFNIYKELGEKLKTTDDIKAMNNANSALLGILEVDFEKKPHSALMIALGKGVGGALYINGQIIEGYDYMAGEIGYPIWSGKRSASQALSPFNLFKQEYKENDGEFFKKYLVDPKTTKKINKWIEELSSFISIYSFCVNPEVIVFSGEITKNKTFQMLVESMYEKHLKENFLEDLLSTKIRFMEGNSNYSLEGAIKF